MILFQIAKALATDPTMYKGGRGFIFSLMPRKQDGGRKFLKLYKRSKYFWQTLYVLHLAVRIDEAATQ